MQMAFELCELAEIMQRQNLKRRHPELDEAEIEERLIEWLYRRPGVEYGDAGGASFVRRELRG